MNPIYIVLVIVLIIWLGIFLYLYYLHRKITRLAEFIKSIKKDEDSNNKVVQGKSET